MPKNKTRVIPKGTQNSNKTNSLIKRLLMALTIISLIYAHNYLEIGPKSIELISKNTEICNNDVLFQLTEHINTHFEQNEKQRNILIIISSFLIDFSVISYCMIWIIECNTWQPMLNIGIFYLLRGLFNNIVMLKYPEKLLWDYPGFPSITVSYFNSSDFFFSGHVGINLITFIEFRNFNKKFFAYVSLLGVFFQLFTMISIRGHYTVDLIGGLIAGHYSYFLSCKYCKYIDGLISINSKEESLFPFLGKKIKNNDEKDVDKQSMKSSGTIITNDNSSLSES
jgi:hypothetical protein